ncbi:hypothetical protein F5X68DRAFT_15194 [Plectosphaerella plurivora]|uniref:Urease accessory protein UreF n=1 Tax=Plectosphaerella plurivora TaxID=936078 RepID=A0A9P9AB81_9PEZI|nr:hypothetical protein F5X68DRAFT_15194 [Plectosphaerella plurivora]
MDSLPDHESIQSTEAEVAELEERLAAAKARLQAHRSHLNGTQETTTLPERSKNSISASPSTLAANHYLLLLSDSALPLGSFAFSSGLESYLAHTPRNRSSFSVFLPESLSSYASTTLPFVLATWRDPASVADLDDQLDACIICTVGRRASVAQGRALMSIWERSFSQSLPKDAVETLRPYATLLRSTSWATTAPASGDAAQGEDPDVPLVHAHLGPLFGAVARLVGLTLRQAAYVFMLSHVKALVSAAVRASMFGPYQAQKVLGSVEVQRLITHVIDREWETPVEEANQSMPVMDLWFGRHELLYSRIFNS